MAQVWVFKSHLITCSHCGLELSVGRNCPHCNCPQYHRYTDSDEWAIEYSKWYDNRERPTYLHDCSHCHFLGHYQEYDVYICIKSWEKTIVARYGNKGEEYSTYSIMNGLFFLPLFGWQFFGISEAIRHGILEIALGEDVSYSTKGITIRERGAE